jgi:hypothetical protein
LLIFPALKGRAKFIPPLRVEETLKRERHKRFITIPVVTTTEAARY